jgi:hypothetical protein
MNRFSNSLSLDLEAGVYANQLVKEVKLSKGTHYCYWVYMCISKYIFIFIYIYIYIYVYIYIIYLSEHNHQYDVCL